MDTCWCTYCGKHLKCEEDALTLYCSDECRHQDNAAESPLSLGSSSPSGYFSMASPAALLSSSLPMHMPSSAGFTTRSRSSSLSPVTPLDLSAKTMFYKSAYSPSPSRSPVPMQFLQSTLCASGFDRSRDASPTVAHQLTAM
ncbi:hypothetical protein LPJ53_006372 [Coemansia erecta]|uniref:Uncharacterized protein n=1 Tax=Coemansia erecta TaxID=147472 RepID=A0A9W7XQD1_9FUNG|nr:hypothetical protein LPJ53_006372 [Coemansia erecta]